MWSRTSRALHPSHGDGAAQSVTVATVSYTHLDVYKRQAMRRPLVTHAGTPTPPGPGPSSPRGAVCVVTAADAAGRKSSLLRLIGSRGMRGTQSDAGVTLAGGQWIGHPHAALLQGALGQPDHQLSLIHI